MVPTPAPAGTTGYRLLVLNILLLGRDTECCNQTSLQNDRNQFSATLPPINWSSVSLDILKLFAQIDHFTIQRKFQVLQGLEASSCEDPIIIG